MATLTIACVAWARVHYRRAGRHCTQAMLEQRVEFEKQIAERMAALSAGQSAAD